ncbi:YgeY family selenium metabolism-linked hydrolase [Alkalibacter rhizosphaerae]|uniref:YgeY family selenium metabolism-linked hydrolase n=1 Tax=Alkalibacter rhizosphaerae TaxID=2815577 RepID=A0A974XGW3_9FIRM|nr:YgeY family selenium metabolism-linked hydrolase [Alkalibacter rhizosphaerae]QSX08088.1 YgeY family selenium metabolism-linked hydrolase [Alkalibacter rhizosphaerae]
MNISNAVKRHEKALVGLASRLVSIPSFSGEEEEVVHAIAEVMKLLEFDEVMVDDLGNVVGKMGNGPLCILLDSHIDTVRVPDADQWSYPPFGGEIVDGNLYGRGSVDMKSSAAASIYAAVVAKEMGLLEGKTLLVSGTVFEEDCDGENLKHLFDQLEMRPDYYITCEPSDNKIVTGHKGKAQMTITTRGQSAHGSAPEKGVNAVYEMAQIIGRVEKMNLDLAAGEGMKKTLVLSRITSNAASLNAVPYECEIYLDRRLVPGETWEDVVEEMEELVEGKDAGWTLDTVKRRSWTGKEIAYRPFHPAWELDKDSLLYKKSVEAYRRCFGKEPEFDFWDFSTNAVTPVSMGIPSVGFGPGEHKMAHMKDEHCAVDKIAAACDYYVNLIDLL